jgi:methylglutaconyl-CoA hydratase
MIRLSVEAGVATVTLDRPEARNALSTALIERLLDAFQQLSGDPTVRVVVLSHTGPAFCAGADLKETAAALASGGVPVARLGEVLTAIWECPKPVVARVGGAARAGGLGLLAAADVAICADDVTFQFTEVRIGVVPAVISATVLPRLAPRAAAELFLTGAVFDARRAVEIGLVTAAVPAAELDATVARYAADLRRGAPGALAATKALLNARFGADLRARLEELTRVSVGFFTGAEGREGMAAAREKRDPSWLS